MECPKCGFYQPKDEFCANCGINIIRYRRSKRKRVLILGSLSLLILVISGYFLSNDQLKDLMERWQILSSSTKERGGVDVAAPRAEKGKDPSFPKAFMARSRSKREKAYFERPSVQKPPEKEQRPLTLPGPETPGQRAVLKPSEEPSLPERASAAIPEPAPSAGVEASRREGAEDRGEDEGTVEEGSGPSSALEWFTRGQELGDGSPEEMRYYQKAIQIDPTFAPAHYYLGVIHYDRGEDKKAIAAFRVFLKNATEEEKIEYPVSNYYSLEEVSSSEEEPLSPEKSLLPTEEESLPTEEESLSEEKASLSKD